MLNVAVHKPTIALRVFVSSGASIQLVESTDRHRSPEKEWMIQLQAELLIMT